MAHKCLLTTVIENEKEIAVHPDATHYGLRGRRIRFFRVNPSPGKEMKKIPRNINTISFPEYRIHYGWIEYGEPEFSGHRSNILKIREYN